MKEQNDGNHLMKRFRQYDAEKRIYYYATKQSVLNNMIDLVEANDVLNGAIKKVEESQELKTTADNGKDE